MSAELIFKGYDDTDAKRVETTLDKLVPAMTGDRWWIVGGLAIRYHLANSGHDTPQRPANDIDIVATTPDDVSPAISESLLIHHYHPQRSDDHFRFVLADPETAIKVDIFPRNPRNPRQERVIWVPYKEHVLPLQTVEDQLAKTVLDLVMMWGRPVDPKQLDDAERLITIANLSDTNAIYRDIQDMHPSIERALAHVRERQVTRPETFAPKPWQSQEIFDCDQCADDPRFPIAPMSSVKSVLGYIELN